MGADDEPPVSEVVSYVAEVYAIDHLGPCEEEALRLTRVVANNPWLKAVFGWPTSLCLPR